MMLFILVASCEYALRPLRKLPFHLHRIHVHPKNKEVQKEIGKFSLQLQQERIKFNARRILNVDFDLLKGVS